MKLLQHIIGWLFPDKCVLCGNLLEKEETDICHHCRIHAPECPVLNSRYPYLNSWLALWYYEDVVRGSLLRYKFYGKRAYAGCYARLLGMKLLREDRADFDVLTWIPISENADAKEVLIRWSCWLRNWVRNWESHPNPL